MVACTTQVMSTAQAQIVLSQTQTPETLVQQYLLGSGVEVDSVRFNGNPGDFVPPVGVGPSEIGHFSGSNSSVSLGAGLFLCTNVAQVHIPGPNTSLQLTGGGISPPMGIATPDVDLSRLTGSPNWMFGTGIYNKAVLEFDFIAENDMVSFRYVFSSEEYERWVCSQYNDVFGWFVSGPGISGPFTNNAINIAYIPGSMSPVSINTVNNGLMNQNNANGPWTDPFMHCNNADPNWQANAIYYRYNGGEWPYAHPQGGVAQLEAPYNNDPYYIAHNGMTVVLTASAAVEIGQRYHMKMAISNVLDSDYPSAVFVEHGSLRASDRFTVTVDAGPNVDLSGPVPVMHQSETYDVQLRINRWGAFYLDEDVLVTAAGSATAGVDYQPALPASVHFDQLDSSAVINLSLPVGNTPSELVVTLTSGTGQKVQSFPISIGPELHVGVQEGATTGLALYPNPADQLLQVELPKAMQGLVHLELLDMAGRVVRVQQHSGAQRATFDLGELPSGLYSLRATANGQVLSARVNVRH